jgi:hypothetical protein
MNLIAALLPTPRWGRAYLHAILAMNNNKLQKWVRKILNGVTRMSFIAKRPFVDLSSKRTVAFLTRSNNVQNGDLEMVGDLEFDLSESTTARNCGTSHKWNCTNIFVRACQRRSDHAELDFLGV